MALTVICGPPCSGKSTYLRAHARPGDITIDLDVIAKALGSPLEHGHPDPLRYVAVRARNAAIAEAVRASNQADVWIVDSSPPAHRMTLYRRYRANVVTLEVPLDELHARASRERPDLWHQLIDEWTPTRETSGSTWSNPRRRPPRPAHRRGTTSSRYAALRRSFLAARTNCDNCGEPFVTDAPCNHPGCIKRGKGCYHHPLYPTIQHTEYLADGAPALDTTTWQAWHQWENKSDGATYGNTRRARAHTHARTREQGHTPPDLDW